MRLFAAVIAVMCTWPSAAALGRPAQHGTGDVLAAEKIIKSRLIDPYSVHFEGVVQRNGVDHAGKPAHIVCGNYNAKNRYGGYAGSRSFAYAAPEKAVFTSAVERLSENGSTQSLDQQSTPAGSDFESLRKAFDSDMDRIVALSDEVKFWLHQCE